MDDKVETVFDISLKSSIPNINSLEFASYLDNNDNLREFRNKFHFPTILSTSNNNDVIYLCGNSLGLQPKGLREGVINQLDKWAAEGVEGHFEGSTPWLDIDDIVADSVAQLVGALRSEVVMMNSLTCNLHLMMTAFYRPTVGRFKIVIEKKAFPSDYHAVVSQIQLHGFDPSEALVEVAPRDGEAILREDDIESVLAQHGTTTALVLFSGVQYYTGQLFDMAKITQIAHAQGCKVGFDLAHAVGNVPLKLHDWDCDFACWCTYKYLNCGPGSLGGCFVHERHGKGGENVVTNANTKLGTAPDPIRMAGWWGHRREDRFLMEPQFIPCEGANGFRLSNPPVLLIACIRASLDLFDEAGMDRLRLKSLLLTGYLEALLEAEVSSDVHIFTPKDPKQRGCQLSLSFPACEGEDAIPLDSILNALKSEGVICDARKPNVIRIAPAPLYNSFVDVFRFVSILKSTLQKLMK